MSLNNRLEKRKQRVRYKLSQRDPSIPRLSVFRSSKNIYAQIIDDSSRRTLAAASTLCEDFKSLKLKSGGNVEAASAVGKIIAEKAIKAGVQKVVFDRGHCLFHGRVKALAEKARESGLSF